MKLFGTTRGMEGGGGAKRALPPNICHTYPTVMKLGTVILYLKKTKKNMNHVINPFSSADINTF